MYCRDPEGVCQLEKQAQGRPSLGSGHVVNCLPDKRPFVAEMPLGNREIYGTIGPPPANAGGEKSTFRPTLTAQASSFPVKYGQAR